MFTSRADLFFCPSSSIYCTDISVFVEIWKSSEPIYRSRQEAHFTPYHLDQLKKDRNVSWKESQNGFNFMANPGLGANIPSLVGRMPSCSDIFLFQAQGHQLSPEQYQSFAAYPEPSYNLEETVRSHASFLLTGIIKIWLAIVIPSYRSGIVMNSCNYYLQTSVSESHFTITVPFIHGCRRQM